LRSIDFTNPLFGFLFDLKNKALNQNEQMKVRVLHARVILTLSITTELMNLQLYRPIQTDEFAENYAALKEVEKEMVDSAVGSILADPYLSKPLQWRWKGKRQVRANGAYRVIFVLCAECFQNPTYQQLNNCENVSHGRNDIYLVTVRPRNDQTYRDLP
jgi:hypothetical protein